LISVEDIASQSSLIIETRYTALPQRHNFRGSCSCFPRLCWNISQERWGNKSSFDSILSQQQKLPKSVDAYWSYSVQHQCRFLETQCSWFI